jgi:hypothetical protein
MSFNAESTEPFEISLKKLIKAFPLSKSDVKSLIKAVEKKPKAGAPIPGYKNLLYKIRGGQKAYRIGTRGGLRLVYFFGEFRLFLIYIYSKRQMKNPPYDLLKKWLKDNV